MASHCGDPALMLLAAPTRFNISCVEAEKSGSMNDVPADVFGGKAVEFGATTVEFDAFGHSAWVTGMLLSCVAVAGNAEVVR